ncbi:MAG TPA: hypothetical protein VK625_18010 [Flavitalea sp.]|nr:hypothetical protein [Flavitalea sp.]
MHGSGIGQAYTHVFGCISALGYEPEHAFGSLLYIVVLMFYKLLIR